jgi:hypothetical protein
MAFTVALPPAASAQAVTPPTVPPGLEVDAPNEAFLLGRGVGTQNYVCQPAKSLGQVAIGGKRFVPYTADYFFYRQQN